MTMRSRHVTAPTLFIASLLAVTNAAGQGASYRHTPSGPVSIVVGSASGSIEDSVARHLAERLGRAWGKPVLVEQVTGVGGAIAATRVAKSAPDAKTFLVSNVQTYSIQPYYLKTVPFDPMKELAPVSKLARIPLVLAVSRESGIRSVSELILRATQRPGTLTYASFGLGTLPHVVGEQFRQVTGTNIIHVPYKGTAPAVQDLTAARVDVAFLPATVAAPLAREGKLQLLGVTGAKPYGELPDVKVFAQLDLKQMDGEYWYGLFAPSGMNRRLVEDVSNDVRVSMRSPGPGRDTFLPPGVEIDTSPPSEFAKFIAGESSKWNAVIKSAVQRKLD